MSYNELIKPAMENARKEIERIKKEVDDYWRGKGSSLNSWTNDDLKEYKKNEKSGRGIDDIEKTLTETDIEEHKDWFHWNHKKIKAGINGNLKWIRAILKKMSEWELGGYDSRKLKEIEMLWFQLMCLTKSRQELKEAEEAPPKKRETSRGAIGRNAGWSTQNLKNSLGDAAPCNPSPSDSGVRAAMWHSCATKSGDVFASRSPRNIG